MISLSSVQKYYREVQVEAKKVVWPERKETMQSTILVVVMVLVVSLFLWMVDSALGWAVQKVI
ncbi:MAG: preprotein translocase subunit SecE [Mariprofundales bacterium]|nr:preprotein translocase subunit SecE [Mariprofundales bacterium]